MHSARTPIFIALVAAVTIGAAVSIGRRPAEAPGGSLGTRLLSSVIEGDQNRPSAPDLAALLEMLSAGTAPAAVGTPEHGSLAIEIDQSLLPLEGERPNGTVLGRVRDAPDSRVVLSWRGDHSFLSVFGVEGVRNFAVSQAPGAPSKFHHLEPNSVRECGGVALSPSSGGTADSDGVSDATDSDGIGGVGRADCIVDVVVLFNDQARVALGGAVGAPGDDGAIRTKIANALASANAACSDSAIPVSFRVLSVAPIDYPYPTGENFTRALNELSNPTDGPLDAIHDLRETYGADIVSLWLANDVAGGKANVLTASSTSKAAFNVVRAQNPVETFVHEVGHNLGCRHLRSSYSSTPSSWFPDSFAHVFDTPGGRRYVTVMASTGDRSNTGADARILRFSNPNLTFEGGGTGVAASSDCARTLPVSGPATARYFPYLPGAPTVARNVFTGGAGTFNLVGFTGGFPSREYAIERTADLQSWGSTGIVLSTGDDGNSDGTTDFVASPTPDALFYRGVLIDQ